MPIPRWLDPRNLPDGVKRVGYAVALVGAGVTADHAAKTYLGSEDVDRPAVIQPAGPDIRYNWFQLVGSRPTKTGVLLRGIDVNDDAALFGAPVPPVRKEYVGADHWKDAKWADFLGKYRTIAAGGTAALTSEEQTIADRVDVYEKQKGARGSVSIEVGHVVDANEFNVPPAAGPARRYFRLGREAKAIPRNVPGESQSFFVPEGDGVEVLEVK